MMDPRDIANPGKVFAPVTAAAAARHVAATATAISTAAERVHS
jgi:hypothetical protein